MRHKKKNALAALAGALMAALLCLPGPALQVNAAINPNLPPNDGGTPSFNITRMQGVAAPGSLSDKVAFNGHQYQLFDGGLTWEEAKAFCERQGGHLVTVNSAEEQYFIERLLFQVDSYWYWLGGYRVATQGDNQFAWVTGEPMSYTNWNSDQPDNAEGGENAIMMYGRQGRQGNDYTEGLLTWNDLGADSTIEFICEWDAPPPVADTTPKPVTDKMTFDGRQYQLFEPGLTWDEAKAFCEKQGGYLATITSPEEQRFVENLRPRNSSEKEYLLGGYRVATSGANQFAWATGEPMVYTNWSPNQPDNRDGEGEDRLSIFGVGHYLSEGSLNWNDVIDDWTHGFICEWGNPPVADTTPKPVTDKLTHNGRQYQLFEPGLSWSEAKAFCEQQGGYLATITDAAEQTFIQNLVAKGGEIAYWLGGYLPDRTAAKAENYKWVTDEAMRYTNWEPNEPNNNSGGPEAENRMEIVQSSGRWNDLWDGARDYHGLVCEWGAIPTPTPTPTPKPDEPKPDEPDDGEDIVVPPSPPPVPTQVILTAEVTNIGVNLDWSPTTNAQGYRIFRANVSKAEGISISDFPLTGGSSFDANVGGGRTYYYTIAEVLEAAKFDQASQTLTPERLSGRSEEVVVTMPPGGLPEPKPNEKRGYIMMTLDDPYMIVNDKRTEIDPGRATSPILLNSRTMVPIRAILEAMGGSVGWDEADRRVSLTANGHEVQMWLDKKNITADGQAGEMDVAPLIVGGRTLLPLRFVAENLDYHIEWIAAQKRIVIVYILT